MNIPWLTFGFVASLALMAGCKHTKVEQSRGTSAPTKLGLLISEADQIVVTNTTAARVERHRGFSLTLSGEEARRIIKDVAQMSPAAGMLTDSVFDWELRFYCGKKDLGAIQLASSTFMFEDKEYFGDTGELVALTRKLRKLTTPSGDR